MNPFCCHSLQKSCFVIVNWSNMTRQQDFSMIYWMQLPFNKVLLIFIAVH